MGVVDHVLLATTRLDAERGILYFTKSDDSQIHNLHQHFLATEELRRLTDNTVPGVRFSATRILRDGTLLYTRQENAVSAWLIRFEQRLTREGGS